MVKDTNSGASHFAICSVFCPSSKFAATSNQLTNIKADCRQVLWLNNILLNNALRIPGTACESVVCNRKLRLNPFCIQ
jgi:hypothetical protein